MKKFSFPLQKLLDIRIDVDEESKRVFVEAQRIKIIAEEKLLNLREEYKKYNIIKSNETIFERKIINHYRDALIYRISEAKKDLNEKTRMVEVKRALMKQKHIEMKTVELLKEKRLQNYTKEINDKEQQQNDEFALYSYIRNIERR